MITKKQLQIQKMHSGSQKMLDTLKELSLSENINFDESLKIKDAIEASTLDVNCKIIDKSINVMEALKRSMGVNFLDEQIALEIIVNTFKNN